MGVSALLDIPPTVRSCRGAGVAPSGPLSVPDVPACKNSPRGLRRAWRGAGPGAVGRTAVAVHAALRALGPRRAAPCDASGATRIVQISWDEAWGLMEREGTRGRTRKVRTVVQRISVDETAAAKGHRYLTLVCDLDDGTVEHIAEDRTQESLDGYYARLTKEQRDGIEVVTMDMWEPYIQATLGRCPMRLRRSSSTASTSWGMSAKWWIPFVSKSTGS